MRNRKPGKIRDGLWFLGREESCMYLVEGSHSSMLISGGMSYLAQDVIDQLTAFRIDTSRIGKLLILHAHFDHIGAAPFLKRRYPSMEILASSRAWDLLKRQEVRDTVNAFGRGIAGKRGMAHLYRVFDLDWREDIQGKSVFDGTLIDLGDLQARIMETPGHSSCSISAYIPQLKVLFASDAGGIPFRDIIIAAGNSNFTHYQESLEKLKDLEVEYLCADHYGYITGKEAGSFIRKTIKVAAGRRTSIERIYHRTGDIEATVEKMLSSMDWEDPDTLLTPEITRGIYRQMVRHIAGARKSS